jgi:hypothetical protein
LLNRAGGNTSHSYGSTSHENRWGGSTYGAYGGGAYRTDPSGATAYHPPVAVPYYSSGCYGCAAAAGAVVGMAAHPQYLRACVRRARSVRTITG